MTKLSEFVIARRRWIVVAWVLLTVVGVWATGRLSDRWFESFSIPGYEAYEANQRALEAFGSGAQPPLVVVFHADRGDVTKTSGIDRAIERTAAAVPGSRASSYFTTGSDAYVSGDRRTTFAEIYPPGQQNFTNLDFIDKARAALRESAPSGVSANLTGRDPLNEDVGGSEGPSVVVEVLIAGAGAVLILLFVFGTLPAVMVPLLIAATSILTTFTFILALTYVTDVSLIVQFLVALIGLGVAIDYSLLMIFRFREELGRKPTTEQALTATMRHAGRAVIVSGSTVAIGLLSMVVLPLPFIRSIGIGGMLIPLISVLAAITLLPALLMALGPRINKLRVVPKRVSRTADSEEGLWHRWAQVVVRRPGLVATVGLAVVALMLVPAADLNPSEAQAKDLPGEGDAFDGRAALDGAGISLGVMKPFVVLAEGSATPAQLDRVASALADVDGVGGADAPPAWRRDGVALIEAFPATDGASRDARKAISTIKIDVLPRVERELGGSVKLTLGGIAPEERDFVHAVYGNFIWVLLFVVLLTFVLLMRAFRSVLLPLKAVLLNLVSLAVAIGVIVFIFQQGHGSEAIWDMKATDAIISWIPLMIFAFLYGLSMDYEVFMLSRMREAYDEFGDTARAIEFGLARTGMLVTSAALVLMLAFFSLSLGPGPDVKQFAIGLAAGIIIDATLIRALLVPSLMRLFGRWNWWFPEPLGKLLLVRPRKPLSETEA
jgi:putative drug exporter of the RND superfamily